MKIYGYEEWKKQFMKDSNPQGGNVIGIRFEQITSHKIHFVKDKLKGIPQDCIRYAIRYCSPTFVSSSKVIKKVIEFNDLDEFEDAVAIFNGYLREDSPEYFIPLHIGGHTLFVSIKITDSSRRELEMLQGTVTLPSDYDGIVLNNVGDE